MNLAIFTVKIPFPEGTGESDTERTHNNFRTRDAIQDRMEKVLKKEFPGKDIYITVTGGI